MKRFLGIISILISAALFLPIYAVAVPSTSTSYQVNESAFSSGSGIDSNSASYNARGSAGDLGVGEANSASFGAFAGPISPAEEYLELNMTGGTVALGTLSTTTTGTGTSSFYVRSYINGGYIVAVMSQPPTNGTKVLTAMAVAAVSTQNTEQFGINLVANTGPVAQGVVPSVQTIAGFGQPIAASGYDVANNYKYVVGDTIAQSGPTGKAWGQTNFTVSYIANVNPVTTGGNFSTVQDLLLVATY